ncbi:MAG TPA: homoserine kinase [Verrucomicrobiae bacterium]|nr:homoserine kinase [Verrucomicrobiae bacterium]
MSVFTKVSHAELLEFLRQYPLGTVLGFQGIGEGVENTNYYVDTVDGRYVLTLFERLNHADLPFFLGLMEHLSERGVPCPRPLPTRLGATLTQLNGRPAALVQRLTGQSVLFPSAAQCAAVGALLGRLHVAGKEFSRRAANSRGAAWRFATAQKLLAVVDPDTAALIRDELAAQAELDLETLEQGVIHADLFRDNVLFVEERLAGVIDFYYACNDALLYDLAVTVNDWCFDVRGDLNTELARWLVGRYCSLRPISRAEQSAWRLTLRAAAFRFWLSRLYDGHFPRGGDLVHVKDPAEYRRKLEHHRRHAPPAL